MRRLILLAVLAVLAAALVTPPAHAGSGTGPLSRSGSSPPIRSIPSCGARREASPSTVTRTATA